MKRPAWKACAIVFACVAALTVAIAWVADGGRALFGGWSFTESARLDRGTYFRLKVKLDYKGAPQNFDIVVGCNVLDIDYKDGSNTHEVGLVPTVYGRRMSDGKGLVIRPPDACDGETTANGKVPADFMPLIIVYDDADTLGFGTAYISDEAYESPLSVLKFGNATIEPATRAEFVDFRKNGTPNLVSRASYFGIQNGAFLKARGLERVWPPFGIICHAYKRFRIPETLRAEVRSYWPSDRPVYWRPVNDQDRRTLAALLWRSDLQRDDGGDARDPAEVYSGNDDMDDQGVANRKGGGMIQRKRYPPSFYPVSSEISAEKWAAYPGSDPEVRPRSAALVVNQVDVMNGANRGFAYCFIDPGYVISGDLGKRLDRDFSLAALVDDMPIVGGAKSWRNSSSNLPTFFEGDEYYFQAYEFFIDSVRGDV